MARHALILINASPIFCGQHSISFRALGRFLNNHSGNDGRTRHRGAAAAGRSLFDPYQINGNSFPP
jgi:hypothetical protein